MEVDGKYPYLLVDISNSRTKLAFATPDEIVGGRETVPTEGFDARFFDEFGGTDENTRVVLSSVVPPKNAELQSVFGNRLLVVSHEVNLGVAVDYPEPATIGADRLANAAAVTALYGAPAVVVDFGTAVTFDIITAERAYTGGVITPGLEVMTDYMYQRTALLPMIDLEEPAHVIGKSTKSAMMSGAIYGYRGMIKEILTQLGSELDEQAFKVVATGGYADLISAKIPDIQHVNPLLTLEGLRIIGNLNFNT